MDVLGRSNGGSHVEDVSEQDQGKDHGPPTRGRKDKSRDGIYSFEGWISKLELGVVDTKGDVDVLEQCIEEAMEDLRGGDTRLAGSRSVTQGVHDFSRQGLECAH